MTLPNYFQGFKYPASDLIKFLSASELFTIMLKSGEIIHFSTDNVANFRQWLLDNAVTDIRKEEGWIIT